MKTLSCFIVFALFLVLGGKSSFGQTGSTAWELHPLVGEEISKSELKRYGMLTDMLDVRRQTVHMRIDSIGNGIFIGNLLLEDGSYQSRGFSTAEIALLRKQIEGKGKIVLDDWQQIQRIWKEGERPLLQVYTHSGEIFGGQLLALNVEGFVLQQAGGELHFGLSDLARIDFDGEDFNSQAPYGFENPHAYRYFLAPSAFPMKKGEFSYQNSMVILNGVSYGISNHVSVTAGLEPITGLFSVIQARPTFTGYAGIKVATPLGEKWHVAGGIMGGTLGTMKDYSMLLGYGTATYGSKDHNLSLGAGISSIGGDPVQPLLTLSGITRINRRLALVTDNWLLVETRRSPEMDRDPLTQQLFLTGNTSVHQEASWMISGGVRVMSNRISVDLGLLAVGNGVRRFVSETKDLEVSGSEWLKIPLPYVGLSVDL